MYYKKPKQRIKQNVDLVKKAEQIKTSISKMRNEVNDYLERPLPKIPDNATVENFQKLILNKISIIQQINKKLRKTISKLWQI